MTQFEKFLLSLEKKYRKKFLGVVIDHEKNIDDIIKGLDKDIQELIKKYTRGNQLDASDRFDKLLGTTIASAFLAVGREMRNSNVKAVEVAGSWALDQVSKYDIPYISEVITRNADNLSSRYSSTFLGMRTFSPASPETVGQRIKTIERSSLKTVREIISVGVNEGKSSRDLAKDISNYVRKDNRRPWVGPYDWFRKRYGFKRNIVPSNRLGGSVDYNAMRIARTEINQTWRSASPKMHKGNRYVTGFDWKLSGSHPKKDVCDDYANDSPYGKEDDLPLSHPHCMCYVVARLVDPNDIND